MRGFLFGLRQFHLVERDTCDIVDGNRNSSGIGKPLADAAPRKSWL